MVCNFELSASPRQVDSKKAVEDDKGYLMEDGDLQGYPNGGNEAVEAR